MLVTQKKKKEFLQCIPNILHFLPSSRTTFSISIFLQPGVFIVQEKSTEVRRQKVRLYYL